MASLDHKGVALISGCSSGFGLLTAVHLASSGFQVVATMRNLATRGALDAAAKAAGVGIHVEQLDVTDEQSVKSCVASVKDRFGSIDVLVNNAGYALAGFAEDVTLTELRAQFETNFFGMAALTKAVAPAMRMRKRGTIINVSSVAGRFGSPGLSAYCATKWAMEGWSESLRFEMLPHGVYVVLIEPGVFPTEIFGSNRRMAAHAVSPNSPFREEYERMAGRFEASVTSAQAGPEEVAALIASVATTPKPVARYAVGRDAKLALRFSPFVPQSLLERIRIALMRGGKRVK